MAVQNKLSILPDKEPVVTPKYGMKIPVCSPYLGGNEFQYLQKAAQSGWISGTGEFIDKFEKAFAKATGALYAISTNSGTSALHVAYRLIGIQPGDEIIGPDFTMISTFTPLIEMGGVPVFVDADEYGQIDVSKIEAAITPKTKAIVGVHIYGHPCDVEAIEKIAAEHSLKVIYDAAEAHGAKVGKRLLGSYGDVVTYSFYANKVITTGEGGMVTFNYDKYLDPAKRLIDEYFSYERHFWHEQYGYSYRLNNLSAAIGLGQTERLKELVDKRRANAALYRNLLADVPGISLLPEKEGVTSVNWMVSILVDKEKFGMDRNALRIALGAEGVETRTFFIPMDLQPAMQDKFPKSCRTTETAIPFPMSWKFCEQGMYLPSSTAIMESTIRYVADRIIEIYAKTRKGKGSEG